jgi:hypothetical protein
LSGGPSHVSVRARWSRRHSHRAHRRLRRSIAWPLRVRIDGIHDQPTAFRALTRGATLIMPTGFSSRVQPLAANDTLHGITPAQYPLDLSRGSVTIYSSGPESLRVVVGRNPFGMVHPVTAVGRHFTVRLVADSVVIEAR